MLESPDPILINDKPVNCLMYADDVILFSKSATGLQQRLDMLNKYCNDWCMTVNTNKTKVLIFNKAGRHLAQDFVFNGAKLDCVQNYKYLGLHFTASGTFSMAQDELYQKALKCFYKLCKDFMPHNPSVKTCLHVFDHTIKPILLYGCEVWGSFNSYTARFRNGDVFLDRIYANLISENLHIKFCKNILGTHKKSSNLAVLSELGRFPLHFDILKSMLKYWHRLENLGTSFPLLKNAYISSKDLYGENKPSWYGSIKYLLKSINLPFDKVKTGTYGFKKMLDKHIYSQYLDMWKRKLSDNSQGKLRTYTLFKTNFGLEKYLNTVKNFDQRKHITKFRISAHKLMIEQGRYLGIPSQNRFCVKCSTNEVEDETHFLFSCTKHVIDRNNLYEVISKTCPNFMGLSHNNKLIWLMGCEDIHILSLVSQFIQKNEQ